MRVRRYHLRMRKKEIFTVLQPMLDQFYQLAFALLPDELEAEQLVIDSISGFIVKERKWLMKLEDEEDVVLRRQFFQKIVLHLYGLGQKRVVHFKFEKTRAFHQLPVKTRAILTLRYQMNYSPVQIEDLLGIARWEVVEGIHNGRFMLTSEQVLGANL